VQLNQFLILADKRVDFELIKGQKGKGTTIQVKSQDKSGENSEVETFDFDPSVYNTISRGVGKCLCCDSVIEDDVIKSQAQNEGLGYQLYAVAFKKGKESLEFRIPNQSDLEGVTKAEEFLQDNYLKTENYLIPQKKNK
jgi:putative DNA methylase